MGKVGDYFNEQWKRIDCQKARETLGSTLRQVIFMKGFISFK